MEILILICFSAFLMQPMHFAHIEPILNQFLETGDQGQYAYGYESGIERKSEIRKPDGNTQGTYSYLDNNGKVQLIRYTAGANGFQVIMDTNLPLESAGTKKPPTARLNSFIPSTGVLEDTPEVTAAKKQHAAAHAAVLRVLPKAAEDRTPTHSTASVQSPLFNRFEQPAVLTDTPEVVEARRQHAAAHAAAFPNLSQNQIYRNIPGYLGSVTNNLEQQGSFLADPQEAGFAKTQHTAVGRIVPGLPQQTSHYNIVLSSSMEQDEFPDSSLISRQIQEGPQFAEEVPRSALGETPEVAAAREAHLAEFAKIKARLSEEYDGVQ